MVHRRVLHGGTFPCNFLFNGRCEWACRGDGHRTHCPRFFTRDVATGIWSGAFESWILSGVACRWSRGVQVEALLRAHEYDRNEAAKW